jgi:hypothetical protein
MKQLLTTLALCGALPVALAQNAVPAKPESKTPAKTLNLRIGDVREYMTPNELRAALQAPDADRTTVVVEGTRATPPELKSLREVPMGLGALAWGFMNPSQIWRILVPDVRAAAAGPTTDKVPHRRFSLEPGKLE